MDEGEIIQLVSNLEQVSAQQFWWDSSILNLAASARDARVVDILAYRHHCLGNKNAFSAHVVRHSTRLCDGPELPTLWGYIDSENDATAIVKRMNDLDYL